MNCETFVRPEFSSGQTTYTPYLGPSSEFAVRNRKSSLTVNLMKHARTGVIKSQFAKYPTFCSRRRRITQQFLHLVIFTFTTINAHQYPERHRMMVFMVMFVNHGRFTAATRLQHHLNRRHLWCAPPVSFCRGIFVR